LPFKVLWAAVPPLRVVFSNEKRQTMSSADNGPEIIEQTASLMKQGAVSIMGGAFRDIFFSFWQAGKSLLEIVELNRQKMKVMPAAVSAPVPADNLLLIHPDEARAEIINPGKELSVVSKHVVVHDTCKIL
jgi:hypothetical protein